MKTRSIRSAVRTSAEPSIYERWKSIKTPANKSNTQHRLYEKKYRDLLYL